jgi:hypothetical protein
MNLVERARALEKLGYPPLAILGELADEIERLRRELNEERAILCTTMVENLKADNERLRALLSDLVERWSTERGYGAIQRARQFLLDSALRSPQAKDVRAALETP